MKVRICESLIVEPDDYDPDREYPLIILLHGYGSNMSDLAGLTPAINRTEYLFVCPNAPMPLDLGTGQTGYAWANFYGDSYAQEALASEDKLMDYLEDVEARYRVRQDQLILGGFSQGGMMTYQIGLSTPGEIRRAVRAKRDGEGAGHHPSTTAGEARPRALRGPWNTRYDSYAGGGQGIT